MLEGLKAIDGTAKALDRALVANPKTGDMAAAYFKNGAWWYVDTVQQIDFDPTHYKPRN